MSGTFSFYRDMGTDDSGFPKFYILNIWSLLENTTESFKISTACLRKRIDIYSNQLCRSL
jgi:hypothetical protein